MRFRLLHNRRRSSSVLRIVVVLWWWWLRRGCCLEWAEPRGSLLRFKESLQLPDNSTLSSWNASTPPCSGRTANWQGILCNREGQVSGIRLENMSLSGTVDTQSLQTLPHLRSLSLMYNHFQGPLPDIARLSSLKAVYFTANNFSGALDSTAFVGMRSLKKLHLAHNQLAGQIPMSMALLPRVIDLRLDYNIFQGLIPTFQPRLWLSFNVSNNMLVGTIPLTLKDINATSFYGNKGLCGAPLPKCKAGVGDSSALSLVVMGIVVAMAASSIVAVVIILLRFRWSGGCWWCGLGLGRKSTLSSTSSLGRLSFVRQDTGGQFEMQELLNASAEMLGSSSLGSSYKAELGDGGPVVVVKRCKHIMGVGGDELDDHMRRLGRLNHPNVVPLLAFYFKKDEKLFISHYAPTTLAALLLHKSVLDIECVVKIAVGVARGLRYLQDELPELMAAHGNLKASNVVMKDEMSMEVMVSDYGLIPLVDQEHAQQHMAAYKSPEYVNQGRITKKTDVWCLGMLILHMLTGNERPLLPECDEDEQAFLRNSPNVFTKKLFKIAVACCHSDFDRRPHLRHALYNLESIFSTSFTSV